MDTPELPDLPDIDFSREPATLDPVFVPPVPARPREPRIRYVLLFLATIATTTFAGAIWYAGFAAPEATSIWTLLPYGFYYSIPVLLILGCHELGHFFACRYYRIDASYPYFIPLPIPALSSGTLGAVIRIRERIGIKRALFDIGIAGPIAGFVVLVPLLWLGMSWSNLVTIDPSVVPPEEFGEPLLLKLAEWTVFGHLNATTAINLHPVGWAAWFGMLATALNLFPIGQLDGGHISYAVLGRRSTVVTLATVGAVASLTLFSVSWIPWTVITVAMVIFIGPRHPHVWDEDVPLDRGRKLLALFAVVMFILCFTPAPITTH